MYAVGIVLLTIEKLVNEKNDVIYDIFDSAAEEANNPEIPGNDDKVNKKGIN